MLSHCPPYYTDSRTFKAYLQAVGLEQDNCDLRIYEILDSFFAQIAPVWSFPIWEEELAIVSSSADSANLRRARILAKIAGFTTMTPNHLRDIVNQYVQGKTALIENVAGEYAFYIRISIDDFTWWETMQSTVEEVKPAHLQSIPVLFYQEVELEEVESRVIFRVNTDSYSLYLDGSWILDGSHTLGEDIDDDAWANLRMIMSHQTLEDSEAAIRIEHDLWYLNGDTMLDGSRILDAWLAEEVL